MPGRALALAACVLVTATTAVRGDGGRDAPSPPVVLALCPDCPCAMGFSGSPTLNVTGGTIQVNSADVCALCGNGNFSFHTRALNVVGDHCMNGNSWWTTGCLITGTAPVPDPLASLPEPTWNPEHDLGTIIEGATNVAGYYSGGGELLLGNFGHVPPADTAGDLTGPGPGDPPDGIVNVFDLLALLAVFGQTCPAP